MVKINVYDSKLYGRPIRAIDRLEYMTDNELEQKIIEPSLLPDILGIPKKDLMICEVSGNSMKDINIFDGDRLLVNKSSKSKEDSIIVVQIEGGLYVKRLRLIDNIPWLYSENKDYPPVCIEGSNFSIFGTVISKIG